MATAAKFVQPVAIYLAYFIQLDVDVTGKITAELCEVGSEFNIFCTLVTMATAAILKGIFTVVCGCEWCRDKIQNEVTMEPRYQIMWLGDVR
jgi:hypothetical protein